MLLILAALRRWDERFTWSAWAHGQGPGAVQRLRWRYLQTPVLAGGFVVFLLAFSDFAVPDFFQQRTYATAIFIQVSSYLETGSAMALALPVVAVSLLIFWALMRASARLALTSSYGTPVTVRAADARSRSASRGFLIGVLLAALLVVAPLINLVRMAGSVRVGMKAFAMVREEALTGYILALLTAVLTVVISLFAAYAFQRRVFSRGSWIRLLPAAIFAVPTSLLGLVAIRAGNNSSGAGWAYDCGLVLLLVMTARWMPISLEILASGWRQIGSAQEEAAAACGVGWPKTLLRILLPQLVPALFAALALTTVFAFNELTLVTLLAPPGFSTLPLRIFQTVHYGPESLLAAICLWQIVFLLAPAIVLLVIARRWQSSWVTR
jgi:iron(III) transport system permease protein